MYTLHMNNILGCGAEFLLPLLSRITKQREAPYGGEHVVPQCYMLLRPCEYGLK